MEKVNTYMWVVLVVALLQGCDINGDMVVVNNTSYDLNMEIIHKKNPKLPSDKILKVDPGQKGYIYFGFATVWNAEYISAYSTRVDTISLYSKKGKILFSSESEIFGFLSGGKKRMLKKRLVIEVDESVFKIVP